MKEVVFFLSMSLHMQQVDTGLLLVRHDEFMTTGEEVYLIGLVCNSGWKDQMSLT